MESTCCALSRASSFGRFVCVARLTHSRFDCIVRHSASERGGEPSGWVASADARAARIYRSRRSCWYDACVPMPVGAVMKSSIFASVILGIDSNVFLQMASSPSRRVMTAAADTACALRMPVAPTARIPRLAYSFCLSSESESNQVHTGTPHIFCLTTTSIPCVFVKVLTPENRSNSRLYSRTRHFTAFMLSTSAKVLQ
jgi:hypothetical protein